jgi:acetyl-CoA carboxylase alpha subunit
MNPFQLKLITPPGCASIDQKDTDHNQKVAERNPLERRNPSAYRP